ncbi:MAG: pyruvate kinase [Bacteroidota bacterium]
MKIKTKGTLEVVERIDEIVDAMTKAEAEKAADLAAVHSVYQKSARNLIHYQTFRSFDFRTSQKRLRNLSLTRLANADRHILASLLNTRKILLSLLGKSAKHPPKPDVSIKTGRKLLTTHTRALLGNRPRGRRVRIMVTQPSQSAYDKELVLGMVKSGMNVARINCAHDGPEVWESMIQNIRKAEMTTGRKVKIAMDLSGPKIRTGQLVKGPKVKKFKPERDDLGRIVNPAKIVFVPALDERSLPDEVALAGFDVKRLQVGTEYRLRDTRDKPRRIKIVEVSEESAVAHCYETTYLKTGQRLESQDPKHASLIIGELPELEQAIILRVDDTLVLTRSAIEGHPQELDEDGEVIRPAMVSCEVPEVFDAVKVGDPILFDDGKIEGVIQTINPEQIHVRIIRAKVNGSKLKAEKGINFPQTDLGVAGLTAKDILDLEFVAQHADIVNFSFVNSKEDVADLHQELERLGVANQLHVVLKIETQKGFDNLGEILLAAMQQKYVGVMIARGDLAIETGWGNLGRIQREILAMCNAAHVPVIWATQVLESLAKKGLPSRSEITDVSNSIASECVMLNKGLYINQAISLLSQILSELEGAHENKERMLPKVK